MAIPVKFEDITIRNELAPGDLGYVMYLHGIYYRRRYGYGLEFESYVAKAVHEFYEAYDPERDCVWICEHQNHIIGSLLLMHHENAVAQLRLFLVLAEYQGAGLGKYLLNSFLRVLEERRYRSVFLWTTEDQTAATALYRKHGFIRTQERDSTVLGIPRLEQRYELTLS